MPKCLDPLQVGGRGGGIRSRGGVETKGEEHRKKGNGKGEKGEQVNPANSWVRKKCGQCCGVQRNAKVGARQHPRKGRGVKALLGGRGEIQKGKGVGFLGVAVLVAERKKTTKKGGGCHSKGKASGRVLKHTIAGRKTEIGRIGGGEKKAKPVRTQDRGI